MGTNAVYSRPLWGMAAAAVALLAVGCSQSATAAGHPHVVVVRDNSNGKTMRVSVGERLDLILASNYWNVDPSTSPAVLRQDGETTYLAPPSGCQVYVRCRLRPGTDLFYCHGTGHGGDHGQ